MGNLERRVDRAQGTVAVVTPKLPAKVSHVSEAS